MAQATTVRLADNLQTSLHKLSKFLRRPMNALINEAVEAYLKQSTPAAEKELESTLAALRAYRKRDPDFTLARQKFVEAELKYEDPLEGQVVRKKSSPKVTKIARRTHA